MNLFSPNYISRAPINRAMREFGRQFAKDQRVLDIGCGKQPYRNCFPCEYVGVDTQAAVSPDIMANAWNIPLPDASFDGIVLNQSLEHISQTEKTVNEIHRLLKPNGLVIVTVPHTMRTHASPLPVEQAPIRNFDASHHPTWHVDYYRFTKFGLMYLFRDYSTLSIQETSGYIGTLVQLWNYFCACIAPNWILAPLYLVTNTAGLLADGVCRYIARIQIPIIQRLYREVYMSLPINYICVFQKA